MKSLAVAVLLLSAVCFAQHRPPEPMPISVPFSCSADHPYDIVSWFMGDSDFRASSHLEGAHHSYHLQGAELAARMNHFYIVKSKKGWPWDIKLYDRNWVYFWATENGSQGWTDPRTYKAFEPPMPIAPRCAKGGFPGETVTLPSTPFGIYTDCGNRVEKNLGRVVNEVWGPYQLSFGGDLPPNTETLVISYRYSCDANYTNCAHKEAYYLTEKYGLVQWAEWKLVSGQYQLVSQAVNNLVRPGSVAPLTTCF